MAMSRRSEEGIALIAVLWALTLLSLVAAAVSLETRSSTRIARNIAENATAKAAADAGIQRAILDLVSSRGAPIDTLKFRADGRDYAWRFGNSTVHISALDESSKIDLNQAPEALLAALFQSVGVNSDKAQSLAAAIADFRDADNLRRASGGEEAEYQSAGLAWRPKNAPFQTIEELQQVLGMTADIYRRITANVTIYSVVDYSVISRSPTLADERLREIVSRAGLNSFYATLPGLAFSVRAEANSANGAVFVREAVVQPDPARTVQRILSWREEGP
jgi:general secretion pathway protein K